MEDTEKLNTQRVSYDRNATVTSHQFYTSPVDWAVEIWFTKETTDTWMTNNKYSQDASINHSKDLALVNHNWLST